MTSDPSAVVTITVETELWPRLRAHLERVQVAHWVIAANGDPLPNVHFLGVTRPAPDAAQAVDPAADPVVGHLALKVQPLIVPDTDWSRAERLESVLRAPDDTPLREAFVQTFNVEYPYRRQGIGRALQLAALDLTRKLGCFQLRSWSSLDKLANYALKLSLGFAVHPAVDETPNGLRISGVYFIKTV